MKTNTHFLLNFAEFS